MCVGGGVCACVMELLAPVSREEPGRHPSEAAGFSGDSPGWLHHLLKITQPIMQLGLDWVHVYMATI